MSKTILLVEDNTDDEILTRRALKKNNIADTVAVVHDGAEALDYLFSTGKYSMPNTPLPDLVLLDLNLPKISGIEVLQHIRQNERTKLLPVVILTTSNDEEDIIKSNQYGANSFVRKPVSFDHFVESIRQLGVQWKLSNQIPQGF